MDDVQKIDKFDYIDGFKIVDEDIKQLFNTGSPFMSSLIESNTTISEILNDRSFINLPIENLPFVGEKTANGVLGFMQNIVKNGENPLYLNQNGELTKNSKTDDKDNKTFQTTKLIFKKFTDDVNEVKITKDEFDADNKLNFIFMNGDANHHKKLATLIIILKIKPDIEINEDLKPFIEKLKKLFYITSSDGKSTPNGDTTIMGGRKMELQDMIPMKKKRGKSMRRKSVNNKSKKKYRKSHK